MSARALIALQAAALRRKQVAERVTLRRKQAAALRALRSNPAPVISPVFALHAAIALAIGAASAAGVGSILGLLAGAL